MEAPTPSSLLSFSKNVTFYTRPGKIPLAEHSAKEEVDTPERGVGCHIDLTPALVFLVNRDHCLASPAAYDFNYAPCAIQNW